MSKRVDIEIVLLASGRAAAEARRKMGRGRASLTGISSSAFFVGVVGSVFAIVNSFTGVNGEKTTIMAALARSLSQAIVPTAAGLSIAILAMWGNRYIGSQLDIFDIQMRAATLELANALSLLGQRIRE